LFSFWSRLVNPSASRAAVSVSCDDCIPDIVKEYFSYDLIVCVEVVNCPSFPGSSRMEIAKAVVEEGSAIDGI
jgi:hypothetical protein